MPFWAPRFRRNGAVPAGGRAANLDPIPYLLPHFGGGTKGGGLAPRTEFIRRNPRRNEICQSISLQAKNDAPSMGLRRISQAAGISSYR